MDKQLAFYMLMGATILLLIVIFALSKAVQQLLNSEYFQKKVQEKSGKSGNITKVIVALIALSLPQLALAADDPGIEYDPVFSISNALLWALGVIDLILLWVALYFMRLLRGILKYGEEEAVEEETSAAPAMQKITQVLTDRVPMEREEDILMDHDYDGIQELDNNLPPWWKWGFYISIVWGVIYLLHFHVFKTGDLQAEEYKKDVAQAEMEIQEYLAKQALNVDENSVTQLIGSSDLAAGKNIFMSYCKVCHGEGGEGLTGANLTDSYWLYGNKISDIFKTIKYGAENGMKSWKDELTPVEMQQVASFIKTLYGTNPPNPKEPQGDFYEEGDMEEPAAEGTAADSTVAMPDTAATTP